jgi:hypothetical protein
MRSSGYISAIITLTTITDCKSAPAGERFGKYDKEAIKRLEGIQKMDANTKSKLFDIIDTYIRDSKARIAYS